MKRILILSAALFLAICTKANSNGTTTNNNATSTAVSFINIAPDSRGAAMGDAGVASSPDANSQFWNPAKYAFIDQKSGLSISYSPWMKKVSDGMNLSYVSGFKQIGEVQIVSASLRYFSLGAVTMYDEAGTFLSERNPNEYAIDFAYSRKLSEKWAASLTFRYIRSNVIGDVINGVESSPANAVATDVAFLYRTSLGTNNALSLGLICSNIGTKVSYDDGETKSPLPANIRIGTGYELMLNSQHRFNFALDFNKLMIPNGNKAFINELGEANASLMPKDYSVMGGIFRSFSDSSLEQELKEITTSLGVEYWYAEQFASRTGMFYEDTNNGGRQYLTFGLGAKLHGISFDISYLHSITTMSALENTMRFSLAFNLDKLFK